MENSTVDLDLTQEMRGVFARLFAAIDERDASIVDKLMDPGFQYIDYEGNVRDIEAYRAMYDMLPPGYVGTHEFREFHARPLCGGGAVMVTGSYYAHMEFVGGVVVDTTLRFVSVWERRPEGWKALLHQTVELPRP